MENSNIIGGRIKMLREAANKTQAEMASDLIVKRETVNQWENETRDLKTQYTIKLADYFSDVLCMNVTCDYILRGIEAGNVEASKKYGLSNMALNRLENACVHEAVQEQKIEVLNFLIENMNATNFLDNLYKFIFFIDCGFTAINDKGEMIDINDSMGIKAHHKHGVQMFPLSGEIMNQIFYNQTIQDIVILKEIYMNDNKNGETK